jgi:hypothetical protein
MQTLTIASQNSVGLRDMGVATSASTFFRQIGGTLGTAVLLSLLFTVFPTNIKSSLTETPTLTAALDAAFTPSVANAPENKQIMEQSYDKIVDESTKAAQAGLQAGVTKAQDAAKAAVAQGVASGAIPPQAQAAAEAQAVATATQKAGAAIEQKAPYATVAADGTVTLDFSDAAARSQFVDSIVPKIQDTLKKQSSSSDSSATNDTSFLNGADPRLTKPFLVAFNASAVQVYWVAMIVVLIAFVLSLFFKTPPLRAKSALQEAADDAAAADAAKNAEREPVGAYASVSEDDDEEYDTGILATQAANEFGALVEPGVDTASTRAQHPRPATD